MSLPRPSGHTRCAVACTLGRAMRARMRRESFAPTGSASAPTSLSAESAGARLPGVAGGEQDSRCASRPAGLALRLLAGLLRALARPVRELPNCALTLVLALVCRPSRAI